MKTRDWLLLLAVAGGAWWLYKKASLIPAVLTSTGEAIGGGLYDWFHPADGAQETDYYVQFSNGAFYIPSNTVDTNGLFTFRGAQFRIVNDAQGMHHAVAP
jgi:hypothetical protein